MTARSHSRQRSKDKKARAMAIATARNKRGEVRDDRPSGRDSE